MVGNDLAIEQGGRVKTTVYAIGAAVVQIAQNNPKRRAIIIGNPSAAAAWVSEKNNVAANSGQPFPPNLNPLQFLRTETYGFVIGELYAFGVAASTLAVTEICDP